MIHDPVRCYAAVSSRDARFDGWFVVAVTTTGIYCRPSCPAVTPRSDNVRFLPTAAAAQAAGFRACKRCRPDASPGSPEWDPRADVVARAMRLIADGVVDREGVSGLASRLGYSSRHLHRQLVAEVGAGPLALARAQRSRTARVLIETTSMPLADVAFAAGFTSIRQFNATIRAVYDRTPSQLRRGRRPSPLPADEWIVLRLPHRQPARLDVAIDHLAARAVPGLEEVTADGCYRRSLRLPNGTGTVELTPADGHVRARLHLDDLRDLGAAVQRCRRLLDLDADPVAVDRHLSQDPALAPLVTALPGLRVPGGVDPEEVALRTILGQQVALSAARTLTAGLVAAVGEPLEQPVGTVTHRFPTPEAIVGSDLARPGLPEQRRRALRELAAALVDGRVVLHAGCDRAETRRTLAQLPGIGPWTIEEVALRALRDPDALPVGDLGLRRAVRRLGLHRSPRDLARRAEAWRPWRAYAAQHLWTMDAAARRDAA